MRQALAIENTKLSEEAQEVVTTLWLLARCVHKRRRATRRGRKIANTGSGSRLDLAGPRPRREPGRGVAEAGSGSRRGQDGQGRSSGCINTARPWYEHRSPSPHNAMGGILTWALTSGKEKPDESFCRYNTSCSYQRIGGIVSRRDTAPAGPDYENYLDGHDLNGAHDVSISNLYHKMLLQRGLEI